MLPAPRRRTSPATRSLPQRHDPEHGFFWASQLLNVERCDNQLNSPHHRRVIRRPPRRTQPIRRHRSAEIHLIDRPQHRPHQMILRQPLRSTTAASTTTDHDHTAMNSRAIPRMCLNSALLGSLVRRGEREWQAGEVDGLSAGLAAAGPALEDRLHQQHGLRECQAGRG